MHFEHWYLEPCIYMHNIRVKKKQPAFHLLKYLSVVQTKYMKNHIACIYMYISIEKSLRDTQSLYERPE